MDKPMKPGDGQRDERLQAAFDEVAHLLDLDLEERTARALVDERCSVGVAVVVGDEVSKVVEHPPDTERQVAAPPGDEEAAILKVVEDWDSAHPDDIPTLWPTLLTDPFVAVSAHWVAEVHSEDLARSLASDSFKSEQASFPVKKPRDVTYSNQKVLMMGPVKALATYTFEEEYQNGKRFKGPGAAMLVKTTSGWRINVYSRHDRHLDLVEVTG